MAEKGTRFTEEQLSAINSVGNIIVSAGAGSGKTTVLTERVRRNILGQTKCGKVNLDELLILTFTNDAATSMKNKIKSALGKDPSLAGLVPFVDSAHIETFDAYAQFIVKKYGHLIGVNKNIKVLDEDILYVKIANTISDYLDKQYLKNNSTFEEIIFKYCIKNDNKLFGFLLDVYNQILAKKDYPIDFLNEYKKKVLTLEYFDDLIKKANGVVASSIKDYKEAIKHICFNKISEYITEKTAAIFNCETIYDLKAIKEGIPDVDSFNKKLKDLLKEADEDINLELEKHQVERLIKNYKRIYSLYLLNISFYEEDVKYQITYLTYLIDNVLMPALEEVDRFKHDSGYYTFGDIAKLSIKILEEEKEVREELKYKYKLIMIDETQDTSESQERFINLIANNNVFSVGDIKQSIYRFRNARPELFKAKYDAYSKHENGEAINMNKNFRSRKEVLNTINDIFSILMTDDFGGANYVKDHMIIPSNTEYDEEGKGKSDLEHGIFQIPYSAIYFDEEGELSDNKESMIKGEASTICDNIISRIENGYLVYDSNLKKLRPCTYKDFTILTYKGVNFKHFEEVFKEKNIPLNSIYSDDLKADNSIVILINIFTLISLLNKDELSEEDESKVRHLFISLLRSFVFGYSDEELYRLFKNKDDSYKQDENFKKLENLAKNYAKSSLNILFDQVLKEFNYVEAFSKIGDAINTIDKNNIFYNKTKTMDELGYSIDDFVLYLKSISKFDIKMEQVIYTESKNAVTITTIHKSKGLEYPVVYLPNLFDFSEPKFKNNGDYYVLNGELFFLPFFSDAHKKTNLVGLLLESDKSTLKEDKEERLRLFYVALTRAKEEVILIVSGEKFTEKQKVHARYEERVRIKFSKNKVEVTDEEIYNFASKELNEYIDERDGKNFNDFLFKAFIEYPLDPYIDKTIECLDEIITQIRDLSDSKLSKSVIKNEIFRYYYSNKHSLKGLNYDEIIKKLSEDSSKTKGEGKKEIIFDGAIRVFDEIIRKIYVNKYSEDINDLIFEFYAYKNIALKNINTSTIDKLIESLNNKDISLLTNLLEKYFVPNYREIKDFEKVKQSGNKEFVEVEAQKLLLSKTKKASKDIDDESDESSLNFGTHIHSLLETLSFTNPDFDFIESEKEKDLIKGALSLLSQFDLDKAKIYKEYQFIDEVNETRGVIDLLLIYEDKAIVVDYKLKNITDVAYIDQLTVYRNYVIQTFNLDTSCYLLSVIDKTISKVL